MLKKLAKSFHNNVLSNSLMQLTGMKMAHFCVTSSFHCCRTVGYVSGINHDPVK